MSAVLENKHVGLLIARTFPQISLLQDPGRNKHVLCLKAPAQTLRSGTGRHQVQAI